MKRKCPEVIKDGITGIGMGAAIIVPGISAGTIALVLGSFNKISTAASNLFSKKFIKNFLILLPFGIGAILAIAALYFPFHWAFKFCMLAIVALFCGLIIGSLPGVFDEIRNSKITKKHIAISVVGAVFASLIGVFSVIFDFGGAINNLFASVPFYLYFIIFAVGIVAASGIIVPGLSGSLILLVISFYQPILNLLEFKNGIFDLLLGVSFGLGIIVGFVIWGKIMNSLINAHKTGTISLVIGFILGSLFSIFFNSNMINYVQKDAGILDWILAPILLISGIILGYLFTVYTRKQKAVNN